ncbi:MAG: iduronate-2-sulfatase, partial [Planctomycetota bacterium]|nr:iduronate-2-sulfatase [Planctomycetota bacterium]
GATAPVSRPDGNTFEVVFINRSAREVELFWMDREGGRKRYATLASGQQQRQRTRPGAVWMIAAGDPRQPLGYFEVGDRSARAVVPK